MIRKHFKNLLVIGCVIVLMLGLYIFNEYICAGVSCYELEVDVIEPIFLTSLALLPTLILLLFFSNDIFVSWLLYLGWWYVPVILFVTLNNDHESNFSPFAYDTIVIHYGMGALFVFTLLYVLGAWWRSRRTKRNTTSPS